MKCGQFVLVMWIEDLREVVPAIGFHSQKYAGILRRSERQNQHSAAPFGRHLPDVTESNHGMVTRHDVRIFVSVQRLAQHLVLMLAEFDARRVRILGRYVPRLTVPAALTHDPLADDGREVESKERQYNRLSVLAVLALVVLRLSHFTRWAGRVIPASRSVPAPVVEQQAGQAGQAA